MFAAREGDIESAKLLIAAKADVNQQTEYGWTPLLTAVNNRNYRLAKLLVERGADPNLANKGGWTPLYLATDNRNIEGGDYPVPKPDMDHLELIRLLLEKGADANARVKDNTLTRTIFTMQWFFEDGATPFIRAAQSSDTALMKLLLEHKADPKAVTARRRQRAHRVGGNRLGGWRHLRAVAERKPRGRAHAARPWPRSELGQPGRPHAADGRGAEGTRRRSFSCSSIAAQSSTSAISGSRDTHIPGATIAGVTWQPLDYAEGLVRVGVQSAVERPEAVALIRKLMEERGMQVPPANRTINSICVVAALRRPVVRYAEMQNADIQNASCGGPRQAVFASCSLNLHRRQLVITHWRGAGNSQALRPLTSTRKRPSPPTASPVITTG